MGVAFPDTGVGEDVEGLPSDGMLAGTDSGGAGVGPLVGGLEVLAGRAAVLVFGVCPMADGVEDRRYA